MESDFEMDVRQFLAGPPFGFRGMTNEMLQPFCAALTHDSYSNEALQMDPPRHIQSYERLEFLGDAVLEFIACEHIYKDTDLTEGPMTDYKIDKVDNNKLSERILERGLDIDGMLRVSRGLDISNKIRASSFEALIAAIYLVYGMDEARRIVREIAFRCLPSLPAHDVSFK